MRRAISHLALLVVAVLVTGACSSAGASAAPEIPAPTNQTVEASSPPVELEIAEATTSVSPAGEAGDFRGCGPSDLGPLTDEGAVVNSFGFSEDRPLSVSGDVVKGPSAIEGLSVDIVVPAPKVATRSLQLTLVQRDEDQVSVIYSANTVTAQDSNFGFLKDGGFALTQRPFAGQDAKTVFEELTRNRWTVLLGSEEATLVWADPYDEELRPFGLYWSDGVREFILIGAPSSPDELVDFARSLYC